jgi:hypothetical protein
MWPGEHQIISYDWSWSGDAESLQPVLPGWFTYWGHFFKSKSINSQWWWVGWVAESMYNRQVELPWFNWFADYARVSIRGSSGAGDQIAANVPFPANNAASFIPLPWFCFCYLIPFCRRMVVSGLGMCRETMSWLIMGAFIFFLTKCSSRCLNISR